LLHELLPLLHELLLLLWRELLYLLLCNLQGAVPLAWKRMCGLWQRIELL
jgi:hypothetical protein